MKLKLTFTFVGFAMFFALGAFAYDKSEWYFVIIGIFAYISLVIGLISLGSLLLGLIKKG